MCLVRSWQCFWVSVWNFSVVKQNPPPTQAVTLSRGAEAGVSTDREEKNEEEKCERVVLTGQTFFYYYSFFFSSMSTATETALPRSPWPWWSAPRASSPGPGARLGCSCSVVASRGEDHLQSSGLQKNGWVLSARGSAEAERGCVFASPRWDPSCHTVSKYRDKRPRGAGTSRHPAGGRVSFQPREEQPVLAECEQLGTVAVAEAPWPVSPAASLGSVSPCAGGDPGAAPMMRGWQNLWLVKTLRCRSLTLPAAPSPCPAARGEFWPLTFRRREL